MNRVTAWSVGIFESNTALTGSSNKTLDNLYRYSMPSDGSIHHFTESAVRATYHPVTVICATRESTFLSGRQRNVKYVPSVSQAQALKIKSTCANLSAVLRVPISRNDKACCQPYPTRARHEDMRTVLGGAVPQGSYNEVSGRGLRSASRRGRVPPL